MSLFGANGPCLERIPKGTLRTIGLLGMVVLPMTMAARAQAVEPPTVTARPANLINDTNATLVGIINPNGADTGYQFVWGPTIFYGNTNSYGQLPAQDATMGVTNKLTDLTPNTLYHFYLVATNSAGVGISPDMTFTTTGPGPNPQAPIVTVDGPSQITDTNALITGTINPNGLPSAFYIRWGTTTAYDHIGYTYSVPSVTSAVVVSNWMTGLSPETLYHYQFVATNLAGTGYSTDMTLTTLPPSPPPTPQAPIATTGPATSITSSGASLNGTVNPNHADTFCYFAWGTTTAYGNTNSYGSLPAQSGPAGVFAVLTGLSQNTTYHYQLFASNSVGSASGGDQAFTTLNISSSGGFTYTTTNGEITITGYTGPGGDVVIPDTIDGLPVTRIADDAFSFQMTLTGITIPDSVIDLGGGAFASCTNLATINLGKGITTIKGGSETQWWGTFTWCSSLTSVTIPDNVTNISDGVGTKGGPFGAFAWCTSLTNVIIGKGLTYLGNGTFTYCVNLVGVYFEGDAPPFGSSSTPILTTPFFNATNAIVYYLPATEGWGPTYAGQPTAPWGPKPLTRDATFGVQNNQFGFSISGPAGSALVIEACTNLTTGDWVLLRSCSLTNGLIYFSDPDLLNCPSRFYRVRSP